MYSPHVAQDEVCFYGCRSGTHVAGAAFLSADGYREAVLWTLANYSRGTLQLMASLRLGRAGTMMQDGDRSLLTQARAETILSGLGISSTPQVELIKERNHVYRITWRVGTTRLLRRRAPASTLEPTSQP